MDENDFNINTACVVADFINYKAHKAGFTWQTSPTKNCPNNKVTTAVRRLCEDFFERYEKQFTEMCMSCAEIGLESDSYMEVLRQLIDNDGLNWGRIIAIFAFAGEMSVHCLRENVPDKVDFIREWTCSFMHKNVDSWIQSNGGWKGLVEFYEAGKSTEEKKSGWGTFIVGALGAVCLGALVINKA